MDRSRRTTLQAAGSASLYGALVSLGLLRPGTAAAQAFDQGAFKTAGVAATLKALGADGAADSKDVVIVAPDIAENGAVVPVGVASAIPKTESIAILIEKNPSPLAAVFSLPAGTDPSITTRVKMGQSSNVYALVKADGKVYVTQKEIKVTLGGCGG